MTDHQPEITHTKCSRLCRADRIAIGTVHHAFDCPLNGSERPMPDLPPQEPCADFGHHDIGQHAELVKAGGHGCTLCPLPAVDPIHDVHSGRVYWATSERPRTSHPFEVRDA